MPRIPKNIETYLNSNLLFNKFGIVNLDVIRATTKTKLTNDELKECINERFAKEMKDDKIEFLSK